MQWECCFIWGPWRDTVRTQARRQKTLLFHCSNQTNSLAVEPRLTNCWNSVVGCSVSSSFACKGSVPGEGSASLILLGCQTGGSGMCVALYQLRFLCKDWWCCSLGNFYPIDLCEINGDAHRSLSVKLALESQWAMCCMITFPCCAQRESLQGLFSSAWMC